MDDSLFLVYAVKILPELEVTMAGITQVDGDDRK